MGPPELPEEETDADCVGTQGAAAAYVRTQKLWKGREVLKVHFLNPSVLESWKSGHGFSKKSMSISMVLEWANDAWNQCDAIPEFIVTESAKKADIRVLFLGMLTSSFIHNY